MFFPRAWRADLPRVVLLLQAGHLLGRYISVFSLMVIGGFAIGPAIGGAVLAFLDIGLESFPPLLFAALRFGLIAVPAIFFVPRPDVRWPVVVAVGLSASSACSSWR